MLVNLDMMQLNIEAMEKSVISKSRDAACFWTVSQVNEPVQ